MLEIERLTLEDGGLVLVALEAYASDLVFADALQVERGAELLAF